MTTHVDTSTALPAFKFAPWQRQSAGAIRLKGASSPAITIPPGKMLVKIPDMFNSFMSAAPIVNPFYEDVKLEAEDWISL
jgi:hypothetical protein